MSKRAQQTTTERHLSGGSSQPEAKLADLAHPDAARAEDAPPEGAPVETNSPVVDTRDGILDVALDLFIAQGFDGTSLRQIAERLGVTKAALYYYFSSKDDILMALHMRLHEVGREALTAIGDEPVTLERWGALLNELLEQLMAQRKIFLLHDRNQAALEKLHRKDHTDEHNDIQARFQTVLADGRVPLRDRVRIAASFGVVFSSLFLSSDAFSSSKSRDLAAMLREAMWDVIRG